MRQVCKPGEDGSTPFPDLQTLASTPISQVYGQFLKCKGHKEASKAKSRDALQNLVSLIPAEDER